MSEYCMDCIHYVHGAVRCDIRPMKNIGALTSACYHFARGDRRKAEAEYLKNLEPINLKSKRQRTMQETTTKVCKKCGRELPIDMFGRHDKSQDGHQSVCRDCLSKKMSEMRAAGKISGGGRRKKPAASAKPSKTSPEPEQAPVVPEKQPSLDEMIARIRKEGYTVTAPMTKDDAIRMVLEKRIGILDYILKCEILDEGDHPYFNGKKDGYQQALDLLGETIESITVEL